MVQIVWVWSHKIWDEWCSLMSGQFITETKNSFMVSAFACLLLPSLLLLPSVKTSTNAVRLFLLKCMSLMTDRLDILYHATVAELLSWRFSFSWEVLYPNSCKFFVILLFVCILFVCERWLLTKYLLYSDSDCVLACLWSVGTAKNEMLFTDSRWE